MEGEVAALSQLQLQLLALVSELRILRERERTAREELRDAGQKWDEAEEERRREARELRAEVEARDDALWRLEARIKCLENENDVLQKNEKNLKESMEVLLQSREAFIKHYEAEKEVAAVKKVLGDVQCLVGEKENVVADLKDKVQRISMLEKDFVEKITFLENKISSYQLELRSRARIIYELNDRLEAEKLKNNFKLELEQLKKALLAKDEIIDRLTSEKQTMHMELHNMETALQKFQDIFSSIGHEGMKSFSWVSESQNVQNVNEEQLQSIPGRECHPANGRTLITATDEIASTPDVEHQMEIVPVLTQVRSPLNSSSLPSPEASAANADCVLESKGDIEMGCLSPEQLTYLANPESNSENQS